MRESIKQGSGNLGKFAAIGTRRCNHWKASNNREREEYYAYNFILLFILEMLKSIISAQIFQQSFFVITQTVLLSYKLYGKPNTPKVG